MKKVLLCLVVVLLVSCDFKSKEVDLILHNGYIYTLNQENDIHRAIAIREGKIVDVGPEHKILNKYSYKEKIDLKGKPVYPGFIDAHCHFLGLGESMLWVDLAGTSSFEEVIERLESYKSRFSHHWILGRGWDQNDWIDQKFPANKILNELFPNQPVYLSRIDGHAAIVNDYALELAGITCYTEIAGGEIQKENLSCTGVLVDNAMEVVSALIPDMSREDKELAFKLAEKKCVESGLTSLHDAGLSYKDILFIDSLHKTSDLKIGVYAMFSDSEENFDYIAVNKPPKTSRLSAISFKFYADGSLGSYGACLVKPYSDKNSSAGFLLKSSEYFKSRAELLYDLGMQMNTHCIGDSANRVMLNIYADVLDGSNDRRWRIEHCQVVQKEDLRYFKEYNIIPSVQPLHATSDYPWFIERLGKKRALSAYSNKELLNQTGIIALGTDFPVETCDPLNTFYAAVFRKNLLGKPISGIQPANALGRLEALKGMTKWSAISSFQEEEKGTLELGKNADLVILDRDILKVREEFIPSAKVAYTYILGEQVYNNSEIRN
ncbi:MAG: amidohydrolase [Flavobacteriales bacterium]